MYFLNLLHLYVSVAADRRQDADFCRIQQLNNMCILPRYNYLQLCNSVTCGGYTVTQGIFKHLTNFFKFFNF